MNLGLQSKIAVVSGSTAGIGLAIATALAAEGARVIINGRTEARVAEALEKIRQRVPGADPRGVAADLGTADGVDTFLKKAPEADVLVNNLGIFDPKPFLEIPDAEWLRFFEVNVLSGVRLSRSYLPGMKERNWGRIVFISSESAINTPAEMIHYGMTKTAQLAVSRGLAESCAGTAVTVNAVLRGPTQDLPSIFTLEAVRDDRRGGQSGDLRVQPAVRRDQRCRPPGGWRSGSSVLLRADDSC